MSSFDYFFNDNQKPATAGCSRRFSICVVTGTRAEYGLLRPLISKIAGDSEMELRLLVTGMHLSESFGYTCAEIEADKHKIDAKIEMLLSSDSEASMAKSTGLGIISFTDYFSHNKPHMLVALGDRFETFAAAVAAAMLHIPIAHICGGDTTEGAIDEFLRHSITKMSTLHFPSNEISARRIIQMGEPPDRVHNVGALHVECIKGADLLSREELASELGIDLDTPYTLVTYHPATLASGGGCGTHMSGVGEHMCDGTYMSGGDTQKKGAGAHLSNTSGSNVGASAAEMKTLLDALSQIPDMQFIITKANADSGGRAINELLDSYSINKLNENFHIYTSLGSARYLSVMRYASAVIGNSSSGLYEAPIFGVPVVNIGDRQKGRLSPDNVINCAPVFDDIVLAVKRAVSSEFAKEAKQVKNPYGAGNASILILDHMKNYLHIGRQSLAKTFNDII